MSTDDEQQQAREEQAYVRGMRSTWVAVLREAAKNLGYDLGDEKVPEEALAAKIGNLVAEREGAIAALRDVCGTYGDNDWNERLHLADVVEKHLGRILDDAAKVPRG